MFNLYQNQIQPTEDRPPLEYQSFSLAERVIYWLALLTPLWWLLGIQQLFYPAVIIALLPVVFSYEKLFKQKIPAPLWAWLGMSLVMLWTAFLGINNLGFSFRIVAASLVTFAKSYLLIFACFALPFFCCVRVKVVTRAVSYLSIGMLVNLLVQMGFLLIGLQDLELAPPAALLIPGEPPASMLIQFPTIENFFSLPFPRTVLHTADPPILGVCGLLCFVICLAEEEPKLRRWALVGSLAALVISFSRSAWLGLIIFLVIYYLFRSKLAIQLSLWLSTLGLLISLILDSAVLEIMQKPTEFFASARASSSETREIVVNATLRAWQEKPWLGWGVISDRAWLYEDTYISLGSFSTYAAVLYLNGIIGFVVFIVALGTTLYCFYNPAIKGNILSQRAFASLTVFYLLIQATPLSWMAIYLWFFFVWLGAIMQELAVREPAVSSWQQLSLREESLF